MNLHKEFETIRRWAADRGLYKHGDVKTQCLKLQEEVGELARAVLENDKVKIADAIGDITVVLVNVAQLAGMQYEACVNETYLEILNRKGTIQNGTFKKDT